jgi:hypothetical protein
LDGIKGQKIAGWSKNGESKDRPELLSLRGKDLVYGQL